MQINITKKQYWDLMRSVYMADWIANAICEGDMEQNKDIKAIRDYVFSFAKEMGYEKYVDYDKEFGKYYANFDLDDESSVRSLIERYDEHTTWDEISEWLGERDFQNKYTIEEIRDMTKEERLMKLTDCQILWEKEFEEFGIDRIEIDLMDDKLKRWHKVKDDLIKDNSKVFFHEREIWWSSIGKNVGFEQNGKGEEFTRPVAVIKRLSLDTCLIVPLTTSKKRKNLFSLGHQFNNVEESYAMVEQIRLIDAKRLRKKIGVLDTETFTRLVDFIKKTNFG